MGYKLLGFTVWQGVKWFVRHRYGHLRKPAAFGVVVLAVTALAVAAARRDAS